MDRKQFFRRLFRAAAVAVVAPRILAEEREETFQDIIDADEVTGNTWGHFEGMPATGCYEIDNLLVPNRMTADEVVQIYEQTGVFPIDRFNESI